MIWLLVAVFLLFGIVVFRGAPFVISHRKAVEKGLDMLDLEPGQVLIDLGSGSGNVLEAAARRGLCAIGYELNPLLVLYSRIRLWPHRDSVKVRWADYWRVELPPADGIYVFLLPRYMKNFDTFIKNNKRRPLKLVSYASEIPGKTAKEEDYGLYLYEYK